jgi:DNA polymerase I
VVQGKPAAVSEREGDRTPLRSLSSTAKCPARRREPRKERDGRWDYRGTWLCVLVADHEGDHRTEKTEGTHGGRKFTDTDIERATMVEKKWRRLGQPQPPDSVVGYENFEKWVLRQTEEGGSPIKAIVTMDELKEVVDIYSAFSEFAFDVETHGGRQVRMLQAGRRVLSRYGGETTPCLACGLPIPSRRRAYCSDLCRKAADKDKPALDTQTNEVWCLSLAGPGVSHVIPMGHPDRRPQLHRADVFAALKPLFFSDRRKINQNVGFDLLSVAKYYGGEIPPPPYADVMTMVFLINENLRAYNLGALAQHYIGFTYSEKLGEEAYNVGWQRAVKYSIIDAKMAWMLWWKLHGVLEDKPKLGALFDLEMEVLRVLLHMRQQGAYVDVEGFRTLRPKLETQLTEIADDIRSMVGHDINLNSTQQLGKWLYDELKLPCMFVTETGQRSTAANALKTLARRHKEPRRILEYKDVNKLLSTYVVGFMPHIDADSRIRASFNQAVARTGRLSCSAPNLQNIPARYKETVEATLIRQLFVAPPGRVLIVADYSQIELRILAHQTRDRLLLYAYTHGLDLHTQTASLIYKVPQDQVNTEQRAIAKNSNFNFAFEGRAGRVVEMSGIPLREAEKVYDAWHKAYPGVKKWGSATKRFCLHHGYVETLYGRKRRLKDISSGNPKDRSYAERQAVNHPIQGTAADIAKLAIVRVHQALKEFHAALVLQIHDEFVIECDEKEAYDAIPFIKEAMENIRLGGRPVLDVPLEVNIGVGANWSEAK